ncbi:hypothetical protein D3C86_1186770 [compost metagenome]
MLLPKVYIRRHILKFHYNLGCLNRQTFAGTDVERHSSPPEVVHKYFCGEVSFGVGIRIDLVFLAVSRKLLIPSLSLGVLSPHDILLNFPCGSIRTK